MTFRSRLFYSITALLCSALGLAFVVVYVLVQRSELRDLDDALFEALHAESLEIDIRGEGALLQQSQAVSGADGFTRYGVVYGATGQVLSATPTFQCAVPDLQSLRTGATASPPVPFDYRCGAVHVRAVIKKLSQERTLFLAIPRTLLDDDARSLVETMAFALFVSVALAAVVARKLAQGLAREHETIASVARRVAEGDFTARVITRSRNAEVRQLAQDFDMMIERLEGLMETQQRFITHAAHELRSPVTGLYGELGLALRKERDVAGYKEAIGHALESAASLKLLAEDLLVLARIGATEEAPVSVRVQELISAAIGTVQRSRVDRELVDIRVDCAEGVVLGRRRDLERLLRNLVENAVRHSPAGEVVCVTSKVVDRCVEITVSDVGSGVLPSEVARIFEPFYRGSEVRATEEGSGIGLSIARAIARSHAGDVTLGHVHPKGACFTVRLPAVEVI